MRHGRGVPRRGMAMAGLGLALAGVAAGTASAAELRGTATYRERMALPPDAVLEVALLDIARADAPADRIAALTMPLEGRQVPIPFVLPYDPARLSPRSRPAVSARILVGGRVAFGTDTIHPLPPAGEAIELRLVRAAEDRPGDAAALIGPRWIVEDLEGRGVLDRVETSLTFLDATQVAGTGGCNRFRGGQELRDDGTLRFGPLATTMMMCPEAIADQEQRFHRLVREVERWRLTPDGALQLLGPEGRVLLRLRAARPER